MPWACMILGKCFFCLCSAGPALSPGKQAWTWAPLSSAFAPNANALGYYYPGVVAKLFWRQTKISISRNLFDASKLFDERHFVVNLFIKRNRLLVLVRHPGPENPLRDRHQLPGTRHDSGIDDATERIASNLKKRTLWRLKMRHYPG